MKNSLYSFLLLKTCCIKVFSNMKEAREYTQSGSSGQSCGNFACIRRLLSCSQKHFYAELGDHAYWVCSCQVDSLGHCTSALITPCWLLSGLVDDLGCWVRCRWVHARTDNFSNGCVLQLGMSHWVCSHSLASDPE